MPATVEELPDDPIVLKRMLIEREATIEQIKTEAAERIEAMEAQHKTEMQAAIASVLRRFYGPRNERFDPRQLLLFGIRIDSMPIDTAAVEDVSGEKLVTRRARHKHGRNKLPDHLPRIRIEHDLPDSDKPCPCCGNIRHKIGEELSEQLEYIPASLKVLQHVRFKYGCGHCEKHGTATPIQIADKPAQPIEKGLPGPGLLAYVITSKLGDHLPLYRLERIFARQQVDIARSTMCAWMMCAAELVRPLVELMANRIRQSKVIHADETTVPVQDKDKCRSGRIWTYIGDRDHPYIVYDYTPDRTRAGPTNWLNGYKGYLQADAYGGYDGIYRKGDVIEVACWALGRRKFFDAQDTDGARSVWMLEMVRQLYVVEDQAKGLDDNARRDLRQSHSGPILAKIKSWLDEQGRIVLPRSPMAQAITYTLNQWDALCVYTTQGFLNIDNNAAERALKRVALGRKNWLFAGHDAAAKAAATLYSLIASAERHAVDPQRYLTGVLARIASTPVSEVDRFLPDAWKRNAAQSES